MSRFLRRHSHGREACRWGADIGASVLAPFTITPRVHGHEPGPGADVVGLSRSAQKGACDLWLQRAFVIVRLPQ